MSLDYVVADAGRVGAVDDGFGVDADGVIGVPVADDAVDDADAALNVA